MFERHFVDRARSANRRSLQIDQKDISLTRSSHSPKVFARMLAERHVLTSVDGRYVAEVVRGQGSALNLVHSSVDLPEVNFEHLLILNVSPMSVLVWGQSGGRTGVWKITEDDLFFRTVMDEVTHLVRTPRGNMPVGRRGQDGNLFVYGRNELVAVCGTELAFREDGTSVAIVPMAHVPGFQNRWLSFPNEHEYDELPTEMIGAPIWPMSIVAERVRRFPVGGQNSFLLTTDQGDVLWDGKRSMPLTSERGRVDQFWTSNEHSVMALVVFPDRENTTHRRLIVNGSSMAEGSFAVRSDGFHWSPDGKHFLAHLIMLDSDGNCCEQRLVSNRNVRVFPRSISVQASCINDQGDVSCIVDDQHGQSILVNGRTMVTHSSTWNLSQTNASTVVNSYHDGIISRIEIPFSR